MSDCSPHDGSFKKPGEELNFTVTGQVHIAGPLQDKIQRCSRCFKVLQDYTNVKFPNNIAVKLKGYEVGVLVTDREVKLYDGSIHKAQTRGAASGALPCKEGS